MEIRKLSKSDVQQYRDLRLKGLASDPGAFGSTLAEEQDQSLSWFESRITGNAMVIGGFTDDGELVGIVGMYVPENMAARHKGILWGMYVHPDNRGSGLARRMSDTLIENARGIVEEIRLSVVTTNTTAKNLYTHLGFEEYGIERHALKHGDHYSDEILMSLRLIRSGE